MHEEKPGISFEKIDISSLAKLCLEENMNLKKNLQNNTHSFAISTIGEKRYIIDCAYRQFFQTEENGEKTETLDLQETMSYDEQRKILTEHILKYGWIEATPENIKAYMDGFEMGKRKSFEETGISAEEYIKRLKEIDYNKRLVEVSIILNHLKKSDYDKIPKEVIDIIEKNKDKEYIWKYDETKDLKNQNVSKDTIAILSYINMQYLLNEEQKKFAQEDYKGRGKSCFYNLFFISYFIVFLLFFYSI